MRYGVESLGCIVVIAVEGLTYLGIVFLLNMFTDYEGVVGRVFEITDETDSFFKVDSIWAFLNADLREGNKMDCLFDSLGVIALLANGDTGLVFNFNSSQAPGPFSS